MAGGSAWIYSASAAPKPSFAVIQVDSEGNLYYDNALTDAASAAKQAQISNPKTVYILGAVEARYAAVSNVLRALGSAGITSVVFGHPTETLKSVPMHLFLRGTVNLPVRFAEAPQPAAISRILCVIDFDNTLTIDGLPTQRSEIGPAIKAAIARKPQAQVIVSANRLSQLSPVQEVLYAAHVARYHNVLLLDAE
jgi:biopolymer transport protein ExbD